VVLYANAALQGAALGMQKSLGQLKKMVALTKTPNVVVPFFRAPAHGQQNLL
jgi:hypothetical protein